eukprot:588236-Rhodomonas_salina.1
MPLELFHARSPKPASLFRACSDSGAPRIGHNLRGTHSSHSKRSLESEPRQAHAAAVGAADHDMLGPLPSEMMRGRDAHHHHCLGHHDHDGLDRGAAHGMSHVEHTRNMREPMTASGSSTRNAEPRASSSSAEQHDQSQSRRRIVMCDAGSQTRVGGDRVMTSTPCVQTNRGRVEMQAVPVAHEDHHHVVHQHQHQDVGKGHRLGQCNRMTEEASSQTIARLHDCSAQTSLPKASASTSTTQAKTSSTSTSAPVTHAQSTSTSSLALAPSAQPQTRTTSTPAIPTLDAPSLAGGLARVQVVEEQDHPLEALQAEPASSSRSTRLVRSLSAPGGARESFGGSHAARQEARLGTSAGALRLGENSAQSALVEPHAPQVSHAHAWDGEGLRLGRASKPRAEHWQASQRERDSLRAARGSTRLGGLLERRAAHASSWLRDGSDPGAVDLEARFKSELGAKGPSASGSLDWKRQVREPARENHWHTHMQGLRLGEMCNVGWHAAKARSDSARAQAQARACLLYTSDAADDM